jgi:hypothetical protein
LLVLFGLGAGFDGEERREPQVLKVYLKIFSTTDPFPRENYGFSTPTVTLSFQQRS